MLVIEGFSIQWKNIYKKWEIVFQKIFLILPIRQKKAFFVFFFWGGGGGGGGGNSHPLANRSPKLPSYFPLKILAFKTPSPSEVPVTTHGVFMDTL